MHLASFIEPTGPKSTKHYIVLHHGDQNELLSLPKTYSDLEIQIQSRFHFGRGLFYVETDELNLCKGKRIRIPEEAWVDIAELLGNVHVVPCPLDSSKANPESAPLPNERNISTNAVKPDESPLKTETRTDSKETLLQKLITCDLRDAPYISEALEDIHKAPENSNHRVKLHTLKPRNMEWSNPKWDMNAQSVLVAKSVPASTTFFVGNYASPVTNSLRIMTNDNIGTVEEFDAKGTVVGERSSFTLPQSPGGHIIALINGQDTLHIVFNFSQSAVISNAVTKTWNPVQIFVSLPSIFPLELQVFDFDV